MMFESAIKSESTKETYEYYLKRFCKETKLSPEKIIELGERNPRKLTNILIEFIAVYKKQLEQGKISPSTIQGFYKAVKLLCVMNDVILNWSKLTKILPISNRGQDRAIELNEIKQLLEKADEQERKFDDYRTKPFVLFLASSGVRIGSIPDLKIGHVKPVTEKGNSVAASVLVYAGDREQYTTFITPEAYEALEKYLQFRKRCGETITDASPLFRDKINRSLSNINDAKPIERDTARAVIHRLLARAGVRGGSKKKRYEFQADHGFRKFFKTRSEQVMKPIHVEMLMGHSTGLSGRYYRPKESELLEDYKKAVPSLTILSPVPELSEAFEEIKKKEMEFETKYANQAKELEELRKKEDEKENEIKKLNGRVQEMEVTVGLMRPLLGQMAKETKTESFTFTGPEGDKIGTILTKNLKKLEED